MRVCHFKCLCNYKCVVLCIFVSLYASCHCMTVKVLLSNKSLLWLPYLYVSAWKNCFATIQILMSYSEYDWSWILMTSANKFDYYELPFFTKLNVWNVSLTCLHYKQCFNESDWSELCIGQPLLLPITWTYSFVWFVLPWFMTLPCVFYHLCLTFQFLLIRVIMSLISNQCAIYNSSL